ncbi:MAG: J domain-containing protein [Hyphomicrobiaceae bacterium]
MIGLAPDAVYNMDVDFLDAANGATRRVTMPDGVVFDIKIPLVSRQGKCPSQRQGQSRPRQGSTRRRAMILIAINDHPLFKREGDIISLELPVALHEAVLGASVEVPTLTGTVRMTLPKGTQNGQVLRLRGRGIKKGATAGDILVRARIVMPDKVDDELTAFFEGWQKQHAYNPRQSAEFKS